KACVLPENPASYRVVRTKSYLFNKAPYVLKPDLDQLRATLQQLLATPRPQACEVGAFLSALLALYTRLTEYTAVEHYLLSRHL
ncbi:hypothetical protein NG714_23645, partial [Klebsiella pneumoniae]|nr:hypothetical protein [Klebsiella pneumoniae]